MRKQLSLVTGICVLLGGSHAAQAAEVVYESFDYAHTETSPPEGETLGGKDGGIGWGAAWSVEDDGGTGGVDDHPFEVILDASGIW